MACDLYWDIKRTNAGAVVVGVTIAKDRMKVKEIQESIRIKKGKKNIDIPVDMLIAPWAV